VNFGSVHTKDSRIGLRPGDRSRGRRGIIAALACFEPNDLVRRRFRHTQDEDGRRAGAVRRRALLRGFAGARRIDLRPEHRPPLCRARRREYRHFGGHRRPNTGVAVLGTRALIVLGHGNCGAVKASIEAKAVPGQISALYSYIRPAVDQAGADLEAAIKANARIQAALLRQSSPVLAEQIKQDRLKVIAAYYDLASGNVPLLD
jgi:hypothetical protein